MNVYIAARFARAQEAQFIARRLAPRHRVASQWHAYPEEFDTTVHNNHSQVARWDLSGFNPHWTIDRDSAWGGLDVADCVIFLSEEGDVENGTRGGRHFELGYAYAKGKLCVILGPRENTFHYLPGILRFQSIAQLYNFFKEVADAEVR